MKSLLILLAVIAIMASCAKRNSLSSVDQTKSRHISASKFH